MPQPLPIFYTKPDCPWCAEALEFFAKQGVKLDIRDVITDRFPASEWQSAFAAARSSNSGKVVMDWS